MNFDDAILQTYPYPLAVAAQGVNNSTESVERFLALGNLFEVSLKYLTAIALAQYLCDPASDDTVQQRLRELARPTLGSWYQILQTCMKFYEKNKDARFSVEGLRDAYVQKRGQPSVKAGGMQAWYRTMYTQLHPDKSGNHHITIASFLKLHVQYRNEIWGHGIAGLRREFCEPHVAAFQAGLQHLLTALEVVTHYPLRYIRSVAVEKGQHVHDIFAYMGTGVKHIEPYRGAYMREQRLYLCASDGQPLLPLHPLFVVHERRLYVLDYHEHDPVEIGYRDCETGVTFQPEGRLSSFKITKLVHDPHHKIPDAIEFPLPPVNDGLAPDVDAMTLPDLLARLSADGRQALQLGLGEALRIGRFWLGVEFLLMGLTRCPNNRLVTLLATVGLAPDTLRGVLRGMVGVNTDSDWRQIRDCADLGQSAWSSLQVADATRLANDVDASGQPQPVVTPRLLMVLRTAVKQVEAGAVADQHLLGAALQHQDCLAVNLLLSLLAEAGCSPSDALQWMMHPPVSPAPAPVPPAPPAPDIPAPPAPPAPAPPVRPAPAPPDLAPLGGLLQQYGRDLTAAARAGTLHPVIGMDALLRRVKRILLQRQANNPLLIGEPGVGKTALVEGLAYDLVQQTPPVVPELAGKRIIELRISDLVAGTPYRGDMEERIKRLLAEVTTRSDIIIFFDEIHTLLGASSTSSSNLANYFKPALARGEFPCIGATTIDEYRRSIAQDAALKRRFATVQVPEPTVEDCIRILHGLKSGLEKHYNVCVSATGIEAAAHLTARYLPDEHLPAKAIAILEQAGAYVKMPSYRADADDAHQPIFTEVNADLIRYLLAQKTGIPVVQLDGTERERLQGMAAALQQQIIGQDAAVQAVTASIRRARIGLHDPHRPVGVFLFVGPSGVGKTALARALAAFLFHDAEAMLRLDMSEYMEKHQVARLIGAPPGYVGYEQEGQLTGQLRLRPACVVLLDEIEKAHPDVHALFLQLFDAGRLTDARGQTVDGRDAVFIMTANLGAEIYSQERLGYATKETQTDAWIAEKHDRVEQIVRAHFKPEFLGRVDCIVHFDPLSQAEVAQICDQQCATLQARLRQQHGLTLTIRPSARAYLCRHGYDAAHGVRALARTIDRVLVDTLTERLLDGTFGPNAQIAVDYDPHTDGLTFIHTSAPGGG